MILALFALSAAMVIGGIAAVIQGFPFVRLESGLAMVIAGATVASAGAVLGGLGVVAGALRRVAHAFDARRVVGAVGAVQDGLSDGLRRQPPAMPVPAEAAAPPLSPASVRPVLPDFTVPTPEAGLLGGQSRSGPVFAEAEDAGPSAADSSAAEPKATDPLPAAPELPLSEPAEPEPPRASEPEDDLFAAPEPALRPSLDAEPAHEARRDEVHEVHEVHEPAREPVPTPPREPPPAVPAGPSAREVVGRYASGGNTYVMYGDGAIEAETPQGRFSFASLDELKAFVEGGGESGARGAA